MRRLVLLLALAGCASEPADLPTPAAEREAPTEAGPPETAAADAADEAWTTEPTTLSRTAEGAATLAGVRTAMHLEAGYDRVVFDLPDGLPEVAVEYVDAPVVACGSGKRLRPEGDGVLRVRLVGARAHTEAGEATARHEPEQHGLPALRETVLTCDFEGEVTWVLGVASPEPYRVTALADPVRLAVDVRHPTN